MSSIEYSESNFWGKLKNFALQAGREVVEKALWLYYAAQRPETPLWAKTIIYGALAYFISPVDAIPDITPIVGYADDLGALAAAIATVSTYINDEVKELAKKKLQHWFGSY
ncbi:MAG: YkvA family protein [Pseudomonadota bacterium]